MLQGLTDALPPVATEWRQGSFCFRVAEARILLEVVLRVRGRRWSGYWWAVQMSTQLSSIKTSLLWAG